MAIAMIFVYSKTYKNQQKLALMIVIEVSEAAFITADKTKVCSTPGCVKNAQEMIEKIDDTVDACDDFYRFSCGRFIKTTAIPDDKVSVNTFSVVDDALLDQLKTIVASPVETDDIEPFKMVKKLYSACMNEGAKNLLAIVLVTINLFNLFIRRTY